MDLTLLNVSKGPRVVGNLRGMETIWLMDPLGVFWSCFCVEGGIPLGLLGGVLVSVNTLCELSGTTEPSGNPCSLQELGG